MGHQYPAFILGKYQGEYLRYHGQDFMMVAAGTRAGKGMGVVIPNLLTYPDSMVVQDIKLENFYYTSGYRKKCGHEVYCWAPFDEKGFTHAYNPFDYIRARPAHLRIGEVMSIGEQLYPSNVDPKLKYWNDNARNLFIGIVLYLFETPGAVCSFGEVLRQGSGKGKSIREHLTAIVSTRSGTHKDYDDSLPVLSFECLDALNRFLSQSKEAFSNIVSTMNAPLNVFTNPVVDAATSRSDFDLADVRKKRMTIYVCIPPKKLKTGALLANLFFSQLIDLNTSQLPAENPKLEFQCGLVMDEFAAPGKIDILDTANAFIAGYNLRMMLIFHSMEQLSDPKLYGKHGAQTLATNCKVRVLFAPRVTEDAEEYSKTLGTFTYLAKSRGRSRGKSSSTSENLSDHGRPLMLPQELRALKFNKQIVTMEGCEPILCEKAFFYEDPELVDRLVQQSPYLQSVMAGHAKKNARRERWGMPPILPNEAELKEAAFVLHELAAYIPPIDVEKWWKEQNDARRAQVATDKTRAAGAIRHVQAHEVGVLKAADFSNQSEIFRSLFKLMPFMSSVLSAPASESASPPSPAASASPVQTAAPHAPAANQEGVSV